MRIALFADIHGNREAFEACLAHAAANRIDRYVFLGDYVGYGADPVATLETVMDHVARGAVAVLGNHDAAALAPDPHMTEGAWTAIEWTRAQLGAAHLDFIKALPLAIEDESRLYVHASAQAPGEWTYVTNLYLASKSLTATRATATFCGHTHVPMLFNMSATGKIASFEPIDRVDVALAARRRWLAVIGAVGQPRDRNPAACYAVLDTARAILTYIRLPYDVDAAARKIREAGLPRELGARLYEGK
jgi:diadenosine tetraphosphatase ApaH/serine/threonine PP2A family protein phosphatase